MVNKVTGIMEVSGLEENYARDSFSGSANLARQHTKTINIVIFVDRSTWRPKTMGRQTEKNGLCVSSAASGSILIVKCRMGTQICVPSLTRMNPLGFYIFVSHVEQKSKIAQIINTTHRLHQSLRR